MVEDSSRKKYRQLKVMRSRLAINGGRELPQILVWRQQKPEQQWSNLGFKSRSQDLGACILTAMDRNQSENPLPQPVAEMKDKGAYLILRSAGRWSDVFRLSSPKGAVLGRASANEIVIRTEQASRQHARVSWSVDSWILEDLDSRNGTLLNGNPFLPPHDWKIRT